MAKDMHRSIEGRKFINVSLFFHHVHNARELTQNHKIWKRFTRFPMNPADQNHGYCCLFVVAFGSVCRQKSLVELHFPLTIRRRKLHRNGNFTARGFLSQLTSSTLVRCAGGDTQTQFLRTLLVFPLLQKG